MTTAVWLTGFEHGVLSTSGGGIVDSITGSPSIASSTVHSGIRSLLCNNGVNNAQTSISKNISSSTIIVGRFYCYHLASNLPALTTLFSATVGVGEIPKIVLNGSDKKIYMYFGSTAGNSVNIALDYQTWYLIDFKIDVSSNPNTFNIQVNGNAATQTTIAQASTTISAINIGIVDTNTGTHRFDDVIISATAGDYPIGEGSIELLVPNADGTHNNAANIMEDSSGNDINGTTYTAWDKLDEVALGGGGEADRVQQTGNGTSNYCEVQFKDTTGTTINGAIAYLAYMSGGTASNTAGTIIVKSGGGTQTIYGAAGALADYSENSTFYKSALYTPTGTTLTAAEVNAIKMRFGYSDDANPDIYWLGLGLEVDYTTAAGPSTYTGNAVLSGTGTEIGSGLNNALGRFNGTGGGSLRSGSLLNITSPSSLLAGSGNSNPRGLNNAIGNILFSGSGALFSSGVKAFLEQVSLFNSSLLSSTGLNNALGRSSASGSGSLSPASLLNILVQSNLSGSSQSSFQSLLTSFLSSSLSGSGNLSSAGSRAVYSNGILSAGGSSYFDAFQTSLGNTLLQVLTDLDGDGKVEIISISGLSGSGNLKSDVSSLLSSVSNLIGSSSLQSSSYNTALSSVFLSNISNFNGLGILETYATSLLSGSGLLFATGYIPTVIIADIGFGSPLFILGLYGVKSTAVLGIAQLSGNGYLLSSSLLSIFGKSGLSVIGDLNGDGIPEILVTQGLAGTSSLSSTALQNAFGGLGLVGSGSLSSNGFQTAYGNTLLTVLADLDGDGNLEVISTSSLAGSSNLSADIVKAILASGAFAGSGALSSASNLVIYASSGMSAEGVISGDALAELLAGMGLVGLGNLSPDGYLFIVGDGILEGLGDLDVLAEVIEKQWFGCVVILDTSLYNATLSETSIYSVTMVEELHSVDVSESSIITAELSDTSLYTVDLEEGLCT